MLVLTRKSNQAIMIGSNIEVRVAQISGNQVRLAISAPRNMPVLREELIEKSLLKTEENLPEVPAVT